MACNLPALVSSEQETLKLKVFVHTGLHCPAPADQNRYLYKDSVILDLQYITFDSICFVEFDSVGSFNFMHPQSKSHFSWKVHNSAAQSSACLHVQASVVRILSLAWPMLVPVLAPWGTSLHFTDPDGLWKMDWKLGIGFMRSCLESTMVLLKTRCFEASPSQILTRKVRSLCHWLIHVSFAWVLYNLQRQNWITYHGSSVALVTCYWHLPQYMVCGSGGVGSVRINRRNVTFVRLRAI